MKLLCPRKNGEFLFLFNIGFYSPCLFPFLRLFHYHQYTTGYTDVNVRTWGVKPCHDLFQCSNEHIGTATKDNEKDAVLLIFGGLSLVPVNGAVLGMLLKFLREFSKKKMRHVFFCFQYEFWGDV